MCAGLCECLCKYVFSCPCICIPVLTHKYSFIVSILVNVSNNVRIALL